MISACILTKDEKENIRDVIENIKGFVDEILVIDDYSDDETDIIAKSYKGVRVIQRHLEGDFGGQRNFAIENVKYEWMFMLDADERCSDQMRKSLQRLTTLNTYDGFTFLWKNYRDDSLVEVMRKICLFNKNGYYKEKIHEQVQGLKNIANVGNEEIFLSHRKSLEHQKESLEFERKIIEQNVEYYSQLKDYEKLAYYKYQLRRHTERGKFWTSDYVS